MIMTGGRGKEKETNIGIWHVDMHAVTFQVISYLSQQCIAMLLFMTSAIQRR